MFALHSCKDVEERVSFPVEHNDSDTTIMDAAAVIRRR